MEKIEIINITDEEYNTLRAIETDEEIQGEDDE